jgi:hypothetical protein
MDNHVAHAVNGRLVYLATVRARDYACNSTHRLAFDLFLDVSLVHGMLRAPAR